MPETETVTGGLPDDDFALLSAPPLSAAGSAYHRKCNIPIHPSRSFIIFTCRNRDLHVRVGFFVFTGIGRLLRGSKCLVDLCLIIVTGTYNVDLGTTVPVMCLFELVPLAKNE